MLIAAPQRKYHDALRRPPARRQRVRAARRRAEAGARSPNVRALRVAGKADRGRGEEASESAMGCVCPVSLAHTYIEAAANKRAVVEFGLRAPSMVHGKKGFSRLEWACKNVLNESLTWLFYNFNPSAREALPAGKEPISTHQPFIHALEPTVTKLPRTLVPNLAVADLSALYAQEDALTLYEYLALLSLGSPRLCATDRVDPHLSRYEVPDFGHGLGARDMVRVRWRGFIPAQFVRDLFLVVRREGLKVVKAEQDGEGGTQRGEEDRWVCWSAGAFGGKKGWTVMQWAGRETLVWECEG